jgi:hypothetical protein
LDCRFTCSVFCWTNGSLTFYLCCQKKELSILHLLLIIIINAASFAIIFATFGHTCFGPGDIAVLSSPFFIVISFSKLISARKDVDQVIGNDAKLKRYYSAGIVLIPLLQLLTMIGAWLIWASIE